MIYDINKNKVLNNQIVRKNCTYLFAKKKIAVKVLEGNCKIFLATSTDVNDLQISTEGFTSFNTGYTIFIPEDHTEVSLGFVDTDGNQSIITLKLELEDVLPEHYEAMLVNFKLPTFSELQPAVIDNQPEVIKRLLLDFREILKFKGTKTGIEKFFYLLGYTDEQITVTEEYQRFNTRTNIFDIVSTKFNQADVNYEFQTDDNPLVRTGDYYVTIDTWKDYSNDNSQQLTRKNLPFRTINPKLTITDKLIFAIDLAKKYFTSSEQDIVFFGISYSSNIEMYQSTTSSTSIVHTVDVGFKRSDIKIEAQELSEGTLRTPNDKYFIFDSEQVYSDIHRTEWSFRHKLPNMSTRVENPAKKDLDTVNFQRFDANQVNQYTKNYLRDYGAGFRLSVKLERSISGFDVKIWSADIAFNTLSFKCTGFSWETEVFTRLPGKYFIEIKAYDFYGNRETYTYEYVVKDNVNQFKLDVLATDNFNSGEDNGLTTDINAATRTENVEFFLNSQVTKIIQESQFFDNLETYYQYNDVYKKSMFQKVSPRMHNFGQYYMLPDINTFTPVNVVTETLPTKFTSGWFEYALVPILNREEEFQLTLETFDYDNLRPFEKVLVNGYVQQEYPYEFENLFIKRLELKNDPTEYLFITVAEPGINISKNYLNITYHSDTYTGSIYDIPGTRIIKQALNHRIPLHIEDDTLVYQFNQFVEDKLMWVDTMFQHIHTNQKHVRIGDVVIVKPNYDTLIGEYDVTWELYDAFTKQLIVRTNDSILKYRVETNTIFDVVYKMSIHGTSFVVERKSLFSSK